MRALAVVLAMLAGSAGAQDLSPGAPVQAGPQPAPVVVINREAVLTGTALGRSMLAEIDAASAALAAENRAIEAELTAEEEELTRRRPSLPPDEFRALADTFDARVQAIRETQDAKTRDLFARRERLGEMFWDQVLPLLGEVAASRGALVVLDRTDVFLSSDTIDITAATIARIDSARPVSAAESGGDEAPSPRPRSRPTPDACGRRRAGLAPRAAMRSAHVGRHGSRN